MARLFGICLLGLCLAQAAISQSFDEFLKQEAAASPEQQQLAEDLRRFAEVLNGPDRARARQALQFMLEQDRTEIFDSAIQYGIFNTEPELRNLALRALFDRRDNHRILFDVSGAKQAREYSEVLRFYNGSLSADGNTAIVTVTIADYDPDKACWMLASGRHCAFVLAGDSVSLRDWSYVTGDLKLNDAGEMVGALQYRNGTPFPARMQIIYD